MQQIMMYKVVDVFWLKVVFTVYLQLMYRVLTAD
jgi:hypothetical protein